MNIEFTIPYIEGRALVMPTEDYCYTVVDDDGEPLLNIELEGDYNER